MEFDTMGTKSFRARRKLLGTLAAGLLGSRAAGDECADERRSAALLRRRGAPEELFAMATRLRNYKNQRSSSWDRTGGNADWVPWIRARRRPCSTCKARA